MLSRGSTELDAVSGAGVDEDLPVSTLSATLSYTTAGKD
jgi:hypothetical protein